MATLKFLQTQSFQLQASGASATDTTITLQSFKMIDGTTNIVTADLGDRCYGTIEPNNGTQEEAFQFTGVTQNASGTATLTGVSSVGFNSPYTVTSGLAKSHAGGVTVILSNDAAFYGNMKTYVDTVVASGAAFADASTAGITKLSVSPATGANPVAVGDNDSRIPSTSASNYLNSIIQTSIPYAVATGTANAYTATLASAISSLASGSYLNFLVPATNATAVTLNVNGLGAKTIKRNVTASLASADLLIGQVAQAVYDGTNFQLVSPSADLKFSLLAIDKTTSTVNNTTNTTTAYSLTIPGGILGKSGGLRIKAAFSASASGGANFFSTYGVNLNSTPISTLQGFPHLTTNGFVNSTTMFEICIVNIGSASSQFYVSNDTSIPNAPTGTAVANTSVPILNTGAGTAAIDTTVPVLIEITHKLSATSGTANTDSYLWSTIERIG